MSMTGADVDRMSRIEVNAEVIHLSREQEEYEQRIVYLEEELRHRDKSVGLLLSDVRRTGDELSCISGILNGIKVVDGITGSASSLLVFCDSLSQIRGAMRVTCCRKKGTKLSPGTSEMTSSATTSCHRLQSGRYRQNQQHCRLVISVLPHNWYCP